jgi:hypothetical protein
MRVLLRIMFVGLFIFPLSFHCLAQIGIITTYAGLPLPVNGAPATAQVINTPTAVISDGAGGFYMVSSAQNRVYRVLQDGMIVLVAGSGANGFSGDGKKAKYAELNFPTESIFIFRNYHYGCRRWGAGEYGSAECAHRSSRRFRRQYLHCGLL